MRRPPVIRPATPDDAALLAELNRFVHDMHAEHRPDLYRKDPPAGELADGFRRQLGRDDVRILIAELPGGTAAGYAMATVHHRAANVLMAADSHITLEHLAVDPRAARQGVATALLEAVRAAGREAGCRRFVTDVWDFNTEALAFYRASGFTPMRRLLDQPL
ncbi:GNAT family N-acetyltransferase [Planomonospora corallina]|uniref:GNAT family N-acetyltransferase n=1 Tax=Planomonospora corallina TaxID=1806052 RepID=A0ABV8IMH3_9ACTN